MEIPTTNNDMSMMEVTLQPNYKDEEIEPIHKGTFLACYNSDTKYTDFLICERLLNENLKVLQQL